MVKKKMIAMLLAGGQGSRLGVLTYKVAKPAVSFGGKYRIIDFSLSNCINSGVDTVGVLTQYRPLKLNSHIGIGIPWDLDRNVGGVSILPPYETSENSEWYTGTANAIYQNLEFMEQYNPDYVLILSGDHIYKMDYELMLDFHKKKNADVTIASMPVAWEETSRFGIVVADENQKITDFEEKPEHARSNLASMGIYIFSYPVLKDVLLEMRTHPELDFGKHLIPRLFEQNRNLYAYEYTGYWRDVGTLGSYFDTNMEMLNLVPDLNMYDEQWKIYTKCETNPPEYLAEEAFVDRAIICSGCEVFGKVTGSVIGSNVTIGKGSVVQDSIIMEGTTIGENCFVNRAIVGENTTIGDAVQIGVGEARENESRPDIYAFALAVIAGDSVVPDGVKIGLNTAIQGVTESCDYPNGELPGGRNLMKAGELS